MRSTSLEPLPYIVPASCQPSFPAEGPTNTPPARYLELADQTVTEMGRPALEHSRLLLIVKSALAALHLLFTAALHEPTEWELDLLFETFVRACVPSPFVGEQQ